MCILSVLCVHVGPQEPSVGQIKAFQKLFLSPGFLVYGSILIASALTIMIYFGPRCVSCFSRANHVCLTFIYVCRYGNQSMLWYIMVCSMIGGISVSVTTGLGSAIVTTAMGDNQVRIVSHSEESG